MQRDEAGELLAFMAVAEEASFTRAAAKLATSQSALSHTVRRLETRLGLRLLARTTRSVALTEAGERLLRTIAPAFATIDGGVASLSELREKPAGTIRMTTSEHAAHTVLWPVLRPLLRDYPDLDGHCDRALRRWRPPWRVNRQGYDSRPDRPRAKDGCRRRSYIFRRAPETEDTAGSGGPPLHQPSPADCRRPICLGT